MKSLISSGVLLCVCALALALPARLDSANLGTVKDTISTSRLSMRARVDATGTTAGSSNAKIKTSPSAPANTISTANLRAQDTLVIGTGTYTVIDIIDADEFTVSPVLASGDADDNDPVYLKVRPIHTVTFTTASAVANGFFQVLLPADTTSPNDGNPDDEGFDFGGGSVTVTAPDVDSPGGGAVEYDFVAGVATASGGTMCTAPANYHCFEVHYSGTGAVGAAISITIGSGASTPIAPATGTSHTEGTADTYPYILRHFVALSNPSSATSQDQTSGRLALIESVRVTATVDPTISFTIAGVASGATRCGVTTDINTATGVNAPLAVTFGTLSSLNSFYDAAHLLTVSSNAPGGYVVTAEENDELSKDGLGVTVIPDTPGDNTAASHTAIDDWDNAATNGFGYSIDNNDASSVPFQYSTTSGSCSGTSYCAKQFANIASSDVAQTIFSSSTVANSEDIDICYRISVGATQAAGDYENQLTYIATGTF